MDASYGTVSVNYDLNDLKAISVFPIKFEGRVPTRHFEGSIDVSLPHLKFAILLSRVFDLRPLSYLGHCNIASCNVFRHNVVKSNLCVNLPIVIILFYLSFSLLGNCEQY